MKHLTSLMSIQKSIIKLSHIPVQISNLSNCPYIDNKIETRAFEKLQEIVKNKAIELKIV